MFVMFIMCIIVLAIIADPNVHLQAHNASIIADKIDGIQRNG